MSSSLLSSSPLTLSTPTKSDELIAPHAFHDSRFIFLPRSTLWLQPHRGLASVGRAFVFLIFSPRGHFLVGQLVVERSITPQLLPIRGVVFHEHPVLSLSGGHVKNSPRSHGKIDPSGWIKQQKFGNNNTMVELVMGSQLDKKNQNRPLGQTTSYIVPTTSKSELGLIHIGSSYVLQDSIYAIRKGLPP